MTTIILHHIVKYLDVSAIYTEAKKKSPHAERISSCGKNLPIMKRLSESVNNSVKLPEHSAITVCEFNILIQTRHNLHDFLNSIYNVYGNLKCI